MEWGKVILWLGAGLGSLSATPVFHFSDDVAAVQAHTSSDANFPLEQIIRLQGRVPVFVEKAVELGRDADLSQEAWQAIQQLHPEIANMLLRLGILRQESLASPKLSHALRIDIVGWDFLLPADHQPIPLIFPQESHRPFALAAFHACLLPHCDTTSAEAEAISIRTRSFPMPWVLVTNTMPYRIIIDASPWMLMTYGPDLCTVTMYLHPQNNAVTDQLKSLRSDENPNWTDLKNVFSQPAIAAPTASSSTEPAAVSQDPQQAQRMAAITHIFELLVQKDAWQLVQQAPSSPQVDPNSFLSPGSQLTISSLSENPKQQKILPHFEQMVKELNARHLEKDDRLQASECLKTLWIGTFPGIPMYLRLSAPSELATSHGPTAIPPPPPPPPGAAIPSTAYISRHTLMSITAVEQSIYATEKSIPLESIKPSKELDDWVDQYRKDKKKPNPRAPDSQKSLPKFQTVRQYTVIIEITQRLGSDQKRDDVLREFIETFGYELKEEHLQVLNSRELAELYKTKYPKDLPKIPDTENASTQEAIDKFRKEITSVKLIVSTNEEKRNKGEAYTEIPYPKSYSSLELALDTILTNASRRSAIAVSDDEGDTESSSSDDW